MQILIYFILPISFIVLLAVLVHRVLQAIDRDLDDLKQRPEPQAKACAAIRKRIDQENAKLKRKQLAQTLDPQPKTHPNGFIQ